MRVLGRELVQPFDLFWGRFGTELGTPAHLVEEGRREVFGAESYQGPSGDVSEQSLPRWMGLPDGPLSYHVAHELTHLVIRKRGFPVSVRGLEYGESSPEARVGGDLEEMVSHHVLEEMLTGYPFDRSHIQSHLFSSAVSGLEASPVPDSGTLWWATWAIRFCELQFLLPQRQWLRLEVVYDGRCPDIADKGRELIHIMDREGVQTPEHALRAMIAARDTLGLTPNPPMDMDGRREDSGRGVRELQGR